MTLISLFCFCTWWWLLWLLPFILGWLLGRQMFIHWRTKAEDLEATLATANKRIAVQDTNLDDAKANIYNLEKDIDKHQTKRRTSEDDLRKCRMKCTELEESLAEKNVADSESNKMNSMAAGAASVLGISSLIGRENKNQDNNREKAEEKPKEKTGAWAKLKSDNLQIIEGIGPKMNQVLTENGINSWAVLASKSREDLKAILDKYGDKYKIIEPGDWVNQARLAAEDKWDELIKHQSDDGSPSKAKNLLIKLGIRKAD